MKQNITTHNWQNISVLLGATSFGFKIDDFIQNIAITSPHILDIWAWTWRDPIYFLEAWYIVSVLDISSTSLQLISRFADERNLIIEESILWDITTISLKQQYDIIYSTNSLHYFDDITTRSVFIKIFNQLKHGGFLCIRVKALTQWGSEFIIDDNGNMKHLFTTQYVDDIFVNIPSSKIILVEKVQDHHTSIDDQELLLDFVDFIIQKI